jgi:hypothetical protein
MMHGHSSNTRCMATAAPAAGQPSRRKVGERAERIKRIYLGIPFVFDLRHGAAQR